MAKTTVPIELSSTPSIVDNGNATAITIDVNENVGIGVSPSTKLEIKDTVPVLRLNDDQSKTWVAGDEIAKISFYSSDASGIGAHETGFISNITEVGSTSLSGALVFGTAPYNTAASEVMRIDDDGRLLVGKTVADNTTVGFRFDGSSGFASFVRDGDASLYLNRKTSDGDILKFAKDGTVVGSIASSGTAIIFNAVTNGYLGINGTAEYIWSSTVFRPNGDNVASLGAAGDRWSVVYAASGSINTSDEREKQDIAELNESELNVAIAAKSLLRKYRFVDAVADKGDDARIHFGIIAQDLKSAFEAEGLDASRYGMFCHDEWWVDSEGNTVNEGDEGAIKKDRMGIRYNELLAFIISAI